MRHALTYLIGLTFGLGIAISGMADPSVVLNFFDVAGSWDPRLAFVMASALIVASIGYRIVLRRERPAYEPVFDLPAPRAIDARLISGAAIFGVGWGIAGFCPGGAIPALGTGRPEVVLFVAAMTGGIIATRLAVTRLAARPKGATA